MRSLSVLDLAVVVTVAATGLDLTLGPARVRALDLIVAFEANLMKPSTPV